MYGSGAYATTPYAGSATMTEVVVSETFVLIAGLTYPLLSFTRQGEPLASQRRAQSTDMRAAQQGSDAVGRAWTAEAGLLTDSEWESLETLLLAPGTVTLSGDEVGSPSVPCYAVPKATQHGTQPDQVRFSFDLREVGS